MYGSTSDSPFAPCDAILCSRLWQSELSPSVSTCFVRRDDFDGIPTHPVNFRKSDPDTVPDSGELGMPAEAMLTRLMESRMDRFPRRLEMTQARSGLRQLAQHPHCRQKRGPPFPELRVRRSRVRENLFSPAASASWGFVHFGRHPPNHLELRAATMTRFHRRLIMSAALLATPALAGAQLLVGTGVTLVDGRDTRWNIATLDGAFSQGFVLPPRPGTPNLPGSYQWIGATPSGTITGQFTTYFARTTFQLAASDRLSVTMRCTADNTPLGIWINGVQAGTSSACGPANTYQLASPQTFTNFIAGMNSIEVRWTGDGTTDGVLVSIDSFTLNGPVGPPGVVPEPSTYLLMATGLAVMALVARRRTRAG
jgi:PEP-CTERM motif